ncbi:MAG TPA: phospholipase D-like domain-containing protein [Pyrinomonadaceae bacterium]|nr:phospholipase D-like domain-containing protein [Pyrinomonadaceae bacterium]
MSVSRERQRFPTRNYPYRGGLVAEAAAPDAVPPEPNKLHRFVLGLDQQPRPMTAEELETLADPFGRLLRSGSPFPLTLQQLLADLDALTGTPNAISDQLIFLVADGGHIPWTPETDELERAFRFAIARGNGDFSLLISSSTAFNSTEDGAFLQIIGWDATHEVFHYYERRAGTYFWAGMSPHALEDATRGRGPFDSHVNGSMVMKELRPPWIHWHAPQAGINEEAFAPDDPLREHPLFRNRVTAERLEIEVVRPAIRRWNEARVRKAIGADGAWRRIRHFLRQVITDTTVNLASSDTASNLLTSDSALRPPFSFFLNRDTLFDTLGFTSDEIEDTNIAIPGALYLECLKRFDVHRSDGNIRLEGDSHFAFLTPEPAFEDTHLVEAMVQAGLLSRRFIACLTMVDFTNPVFSDRRAALLRYVPDEVNDANPAAAMESQFVNAVRDAVATGVNGAAQADSPEREFLSNWDTEDFESVFIQRIADYCSALTAGMTDPEVVDGWFRLMEHRRRRFRRRPLAEFSLTTPRTNIPEDAPPLRMNQQGRVEPVNPVTPPSDSPTSEEPIPDNAKRRTVMNRFDPPGFLDDMNDAQKDQWSQIISTWIDRAHAGKPAQNDGPRNQFFNPLTNPPADDQQVAVISWNAFPRQVMSSSISAKQRWRRADADRNVQDEYCEWSVTRDPVSRKITRVTFTCEGPEYWQVLATMNPEKVLALYREFISPLVKREDLFQNGKYNPFNSFNNSTTRGAMHLIQGANSLQAEIELGAAATIRRIKNGAELTSAQALITCSRYGEAGRNSDPHIGEQVNNLARQRADITINNPVGLYLHEFNPVGWTTPDGKDPREFWKFVRGKDNHFVRAVFEVPAHLGYTVGDIKIAGRNIEFGAQIVDFITIKLEGLATRIGQSTTTPFQGCRGELQPEAAAPEAPDSLVDMLTESLPLRSRGEGVAASSAAPPGMLSESVAGADDAAEQALIARLPEALRRDAELIELEAAPPALLSYPRLPLEHFATRLVSGKIMAYASPDSTYAVTKKLLDSAHRSIVIGIYDFRADYMKETLKKAMMRGVKVSLMLDTNSDDDPNLFPELIALGATCVRAPSSSAGNPIAYFGNAHEKIIVVDDEIVMIQSGNWSQNSIPFNEGDGEIIGQFVMGNRDMGMAVQSTELARLFSDLVARDMRLAQGQPPDFVAESAPAAAPTPASAIFFEAAPPEPPTHLFSSLTVTPSTPVRVTPVVTPENFHDTARGFIRTARQSILIEQQYIRGGQNAIEELLAEIDAARAQSPGLRVRIIVSPKFLTGNNRKNFLRAMENHHLAFDDNFRFLSSTHFVHCHNKLIVVDNEKVLLGSQNWSTTGVLSNREASLLVEHAGIAAYFAQIFNSDWDMSEPDAPPDALFAAAVEGLAQPADFAEGGVVISSVKDYTDV